MLRWRAIPPEQTVGASCRLPPRPGNQFRHSNSRVLTPDIIHERAVVDRHDGGIAGHLLIPSTGADVDYRIRIPAKRLAVIALRIMHSIIPSVLRTTVPHLEFSAVNADKRL